MAKKAAKQTAETTLRVIDRGFTRAETGEPLRDVYLVHRFAPPNNAGWETLLCRVNTPLCLVKVLTDWAISVGLTVEDVSQPFPAAGPVPAPPAVPATLFDEVE